MATRKKSKEPEQERKKTPEEIEAEVESYLPSHSIGTNPIEMALEAIPQMKSADMEFIELEKMKWHTLENFLAGKRNQKTEISKDERKILPLLELMAENPFDYSQKNKYRKDNPYHISEGKDQDTYKIEPLRMFLDQFYELGIPVKRQGRKEEVAVLQAAMQKTLVEQEEKKEKPVLTK